MDCIKAAEACSLFSCTSFSLPPSPLSVLCQVKWRSLISANGGHSPATRFFSDINSFAPPYLFGILLLTATKDRLTDAHCTVDISVKTERLDQSDCSSKVASTPQSVLFPLSDGLSETVQVFNQTDKQAQFARNVTHAFSINVKRTV